MPIKSILFLLLVPAFSHAAASAAAAPAARPETPENRVASIFVSQDFLNEQIELHNTSELVKKLKIELDPVKGQIFLRGLLQVPVEELKAVNLEPRLGAFRFQLTIKPEVNERGFLILDFPLAETYFYPAGSKDLVNDRVVVPVQMLSLALASARGYLSALSGDFSGFDRRTAKLNALLKNLNRGIATEKNADAREDLVEQRTSLKLQLAAVPIERKQLEKLSKHLEALLGFTGEKELDLNEELRARKNALMFKIKISHLAPYLQGVQLGGVRLLRDKKDGNGENFLAIDVNSIIEGAVPGKSRVPAAARPAMKVAPSLIVRINQSLFESEAVIEAEKKKVGGKIRDLDIGLKDDGLHITGAYQTFLFSIPFDSAVDFVTTAPDVFEARVRELKIAGLDLEFLTGFVLEALQARLELALKGMCDFKYVGEEKDHSRALQVSVNPQKLVPAFPGLHLVKVDVRDREFLLKVGHPN